MDNERGLLLLKLVTGVGKKDELLVLKKKEVIVVKALTLPNLEVLRTVETLGLAVHSFNKLISINKYALKHIPVKIDVTKEVLNTNTFKNLKVSLLITLKTLW